MSNDAIARIQKLRDEAQQTYSETVVPGVSDDSVLETEIETYDAVLAILQADAPADGRMCIEYHGEAYESFRNALDLMHGYGCEITPIEGEPFDAILVGADREADDGATVSFVRNPDDYDYDLRRVPREKIESAVVDHITVS